MRWDFLNDKPLCASAEPDRVKDLAGEGGMEKPKACRTTRMRTKSNEQDPHAPGYGKRLPEIRKKERRT